MTIPPAATAKVTGNLAAMPDVTLSFWNSDWPRLPCTAPLSHRQYWAKKPWLRWSCLVILAISAGVALVPPASATAGLPGMIRMSEKIPSEIRNNSRIEISNRRAMKEGSEPPLPVAIAAV